MKTDYQSGKLNDFNFMISINCFPDIVSKAGKVVDIILYKATGHKIWSEWI